MTNEKKGLFAESVKMAMKKARERQCKEYERKKVSIRKKLEKEYQSSWKLLIAECASRGECSCFILLEEKVQYVTTNWAGSDTVDDLASGRQSDYYLKAEIAVEILRANGFNASRGEQIVGEFTPRVPFYKDGGIDVCWG